MDDAKYGEKTANALSLLPRETKQHGLFNPPRLTSLQARYTLANPHSHYPERQPISYVDWFPALLMWLCGIHSNGSPLATARGLKSVLGYIEGLAER